MPTKLPKKKVKKDEMLCPVCNDGSKVTFDAGSQKLGKCTKGHKLTATLKVHKLSWRECK